MIAQQEKIEEKKLSQKMSIRIDLAARGSFGALEAHKKRHPLKCIVKKELIPFIVRRVAWIMEDKYLPIYDELAITIPDEKFIKSRWPEICLSAAETYHKYIVWEPFVGVRLGSFEEYQEIPALRLFPIIRGEIKNSTKRARVIVALGGECLVMEETTRLLKSGVE